MLSFLFAPENVPFLIALGLMVAIGLLEGVTLVLGTGASSLLDTLLPDTDIDSDFDLGDLHAHGPIAKMLGWLHIGRVPVLVLLVLFLFGFGFLGLVVQSITLGMAGMLLPGWIASLPALGGAFCLVHVSGGLLARIIPKDESDAVSENSFVGRIAEITMGRAWRGHPAQAKLQDRHGRTHYVFVEPDEDGKTFETGARLLIVSREGPVFHAIENPSQALVD